MKIIIDTKILKKKKIPISSYLLALSLYDKNDINKEDYEFLAKNNYIIWNKDNNINMHNYPELTDLGKAFVEDMIILSEANNTSDLKVLAKALKDIYPKGKKDGKYPWSEGVALIEKRLQLFYKKYGTKEDGTLYTPDEIIDATKKYLASFNGNYQYLQLLKYFIFKEKVDISGERDSTSSLLTFLEAEEDEFTNLSQDWDIILK